MNKYVGSRYVPIYIGIHDDNIEYEPLSIVSNSEKTETYTSKQHVPIGVSLDNETYWAQSGFSNADLQIDVDNAPVVSTDDSELVIEKTTNGYLLTLSDSNSFDCGGDYGESYTLNTMYDVGRYMIKPSICTGVPSEISDIDNPAELIIADYTETGNNIMKQYQKITAFDDDNAASFIRIHDGNKWGDWKMIGGSGGGSYVLPVATSSVLGGVKIGDGINITDDGIISVESGQSVDSKWETITPILKSGYSSKGSIVNFCVNKSAKMFRATVRGSIESGVFSNTANNGKQIEIGTNSLRLPIDLDDLASKISTSKRISPIETLGNNHNIVSTIANTGNYDAAIVDINYSVTYSSEIANVLDIVTTSALIFANSDNHVSKNFVAVIYIPYELV